MTKLLGAFAWVFAATGMAQVGSYLGPGVMSNGSGTIGDRSGAPVDLRMFASVSGFYDTGLVPFALNSQGQLENLSGLYGEQLSGGVYGTHTWHNSVLGLDFSGSLYHYDDYSQFDGSTAYLMLGYTYQKSRHIVFNLKQVAGTSSLPYGYGSAYEPSTVLTNQPTAELFDNRFYFLQSTAEMSYVQSSRLSYTMGGDGYLVDRQASALANLRGYTARGVIRYRLSQRKTLGFQYQHYFMDFPPSFGQSTTDMGQAFFASSVGKNWTYRLVGGAFNTEVSGVEQISINPVIAALLGTSVGIRAFYRQDIYPAVEANLSGHMKNSFIGFDAAETIAPGNGVYLTSRQISGTASYSYTGIRKWNFGISGGYYKLDAIGQGIQPYSGLTGGAGFTYGLTRAFHLVGRYDYRRQEIVLVNGFRNDSYRVSMGLAFSPGDVPLSLW